MGEAIKKGASHFFKKAAESFIPLVVYGAPIATGAVILANEINPQILENVIQFISKPIIFSPK